MSAPEHTPGPWGAFQRPKEVGTNYWRITFSDRTSDSLCGYCGEDNARLIAAAPSLYTAALWAHAELKRLGYDGCAKGECEICAALAKVGGK